MRWWISQIKLWSATKKKKKKADESSRNCMEIIQQHQLACFACKFASFELAVYHWLSCRVNFQAKQRFTWKNKTRKTFRRWSIYAQTEWVNELKIQLLVLHKLKRDLNMEARNLHNDCLRVTILNIALISKLAANAHKQESFTTNASEEFYDEANKHIKPSKYKLIF
jgi:hypothetical protein